MEAFMFILLAVAFCLNVHSTERTFCKMRQEIKDLQKSLLIISNHRNIVVDEFHDSVDSVD